MNVWWLVPALFALGAGVAFLMLGPVPLRALAARVPALVWQALAAIVAVSLASSWLIGIGEGRCEAKQAKAEAKADVKAAGVAAKADAEAKEATTIIREESQNAQVRIRELVRTVPGACSAMPDELRDILQREVEAARAELQAGARDRDRGRAD